MATSSVSGRADGRWLSCAEAARINSNQSLGNTSQTPRSRAFIEVAMVTLLFKNRICMYNRTCSCVRVTIVAFKKQSALHILSVCVCVCVRERTRARERESVCVCV